MTTFSSKTALMVAAHRGAASARSNAICNDPWAFALAGEEGRALAARFDSAFPQMELWIAVRTAFFDRCVRSWIDAGISQIVLLGAGLDTRAARLAAPGVRFFEVDHPGTQAEKIKRLAALAGYPQGAAICAACDFSSDDFVPQLVAAGFSTAAPAGLVWEGVTPYLTEDIVRTTLHRVASGCHPESVVGFDHVMKKFAQGVALGARHQESRDVLAGAGEPMRFGINDTTPLLHEVGFRHILSVSFDQACLAFTGTYDRAREFRFQHLVLASAARMIFP